MATTQQAPSRTPTQKTSTDRPQNCRMKRRTERKSLTIPPSLSIQHSQLESLTGQKAHESAFRTTTTSSCWFSSATSNGVFPSAFLASRSAFLHQPNQWPGQAQHVVCLEGVGVPTHEPNSGIGCTACVRHRSWIWMLLLNYRLVP